MHKLILIEGIPGSGKTTISKKIYNYLQDNGSKVTHYNEGDSHPVDLSWQSILTLDEYDTIIREYPEYEKVIMSNSILESNFAITAYTSLNINRDSDLYGYLESKEIYSQDTDIDTFKQAHLRRWKKFVETADSNSIYVFECVLLQNHITQLMLEYDVTEEVIYSYIMEFMTIVDEMSPVIIYLAPESVEKAIKHVAKERAPKYQDRQDVWIDRVIEYISNTPYGVTHGIDDIDRCIKFFSIRQEIEKRLLSNMNVDSNIIEHDGEDWDRVLQCATQVL